MAKAKPNSITYGTAGVGSGPHVNIARLQNVAGIKLVPVHYRGATPSLNDVMGGHTNMMLISVSSALPNFRAGQVKMIGIGSPKRLPQVAGRPHHRRERQPAGLHRGNLVRHGRDRRNAAGRSCRKSTPRCSRSSTIRRSASASSAKQLYEPMTSSTAGVRGLHQDRAAELGQGDPRAESGDRALARCALSAMRRRTDQTAKFQTIEVASDSA